MIIDQNTKIGSILKHNPASLDAIVSISPKFEKLRNPVLRKLMAGRASIAMASKIGGCRVDDFFEKLAPLGFDIDAATPAIAVTAQDAPGFIKTLNDGQLVVLDVRPIIQSGEDPLNQILQKIKTLQSGQVLKIVNTFEPTPLMLLLQKQGFESYAMHVNDNLVETWFYKTGAWQPAETPVQRGDWDEVLKRFKLQIIDVRGLQMPQPMYTILENLDHLAAGTALFVYHKRIPVFLLPELAQRKFDYRIKEINSEEVHILIFRD
ncbi:DUF2249 domain-containing protein [Chitinophaga sp.]|uniref:DUF2249 domain-containing protein n=1 Tax=Chitinophaga sp. TaxID=1869181 RepID=UPI0031D4C1EF